MAMFDARQAAEEHAQAHGTEPFRFVGMDGDEYALPPFSSLSVGHAKRLLAGDFDVLTEVADEDACAAIDDMPLVLLEQLGTAWSDGASDEGKSGSAPSETPTISKPSKRTSRSAASR